jgi:hypothetical protein
LILYLRRRSNDVRSDDALSFLEGRPMAEFDYNAAAKLLPTRRRAPRRQWFGFRRFAQAAQAIRFAKENMPPACLVGAFLEVDERRCNSDDIRRLCESAEYPLTRHGARS